MVVARVNFGSELLLRTGKVDGLSIKLFDHLGPFLLNPITHFRMNVQGQVGAALDRFCSDAPGLNPDRMSTQERV